MVNQLSPQRASPVLLLDPARAPSRLGKEFGKCCIISAPFPTMFACLGASYSAHSWAMLAEIATITGVGTGVACGCTVMWYFGHVHIVQRIKEVINKVFGPPVKPINIEIPLVICEIVASYVPDEMIEVDPLYALPLLKKFPEELVTTLKRQPEKFEIAIGQIEAALHPQPNQSIPTVTRNNAQRAIAAAILQTVDTVLSPIRTDFSILSLEQVLAALRRLKRAELDEDTAELAKAELNETNNREKIQEINKNIALNRAVLEFSTSEQFAQINIDDANHRLQPDAAALCNQWRSLLNIQRTLSAEADEKAQIANQNVIISDRMIQPKLYVDLCNIRADREIQNLFDYGLVRFAIVLISVGAVVPELLEILRFPHASQAEKANAVRTWFNREHLEWRKIEILDLSELRITSLSSEILAVLQRMPDLHHLDLRSLESIPFPEAFSPLTQVETFILPANLVPFLPAPFSTFSRKNL